MRSRIMIPALLVVLAGERTASAGENVRSIPTYQCRYTLPGKDWSWSEPTSGVQAVCMARNGDGLVFMLTVLPVPAHTIIDADFATEFDQNAYPVAATKKRGGRITNFKGLPCYESEGLLNGKFTAVYRVLVANGFAYQLQLLGNADPVEKRPDFEAIMNGFEFTSPPVPHSAATTDPHERGKKIARRMGEVAAYCLAGAVVLGLLIRGARKKSNSL
jgi:hypothetical protein